MMAKDHREAQPPTVDQLAARLREQGKPLEPAQLLRTLASVAAAAESIQIAPDLPVDSSTLTDIEVQAMRVDLLRYGAAPCAPS